MLCTNKLAYSSTLEFIILLSALPRIFILPMGLKLLANIFEYHFFSLISFPYHVALRLPFQVSSGVFLFLKQYLEKYPEEAASTDLLASVLSFLSTLMLAQGQELFYLLASVHMKMTSAALSKLSLFYPPSLNTHSQSYGCF